MAAFVFNFSFLDSKKRNLLFSIQGGRKTFHSSHLQKKKKKKGKEMSRRIFTRNANGQLMNSGRSSSFNQSVMNITSATFGCTGFVGKYVHAVSTYHNFTNICPFRFRGGFFGGIRTVKFLGDGTFGQQFPTDYEIDKEFVVKAILEKIDTVFNCVGCWQEPALYEHNQSWFSMEAINVEWPRMLARWCREMGVHRFVHLSMVGADVNSRSKLLRQKALAEQAVLDEFPRATIIRSTDMFAEDDWTYSRFLKSQRIAKIVPVPNGGQRIHQPVFVGDIAEAAVRCVTIDGTEGRIVELGGPVRCTTNDLYRWAAEMNCLNNLVYPMPDALWKPLLYINERCLIRRGFLMGAKPVCWTQDWLDRQYIDNVAMPERNPELLDWEDLGIAREDLYRLEEKYFRGGMAWSVDDPYQENARYL